MTTSEVRPSAIAGSFYPANPQALRQEVGQRLQRARQAISVEGLAPKMLVVPHAGHQYSGNLAAIAYACLGPTATKLKRVVILAPAHRVAFQGCALPEATSMATPLGNVVIDHDAVQMLCELDFVSQRADVHAQEHAVEVHLPFIQLLMPQASVVPLVIGNASDGQVAQIIDSLWGGRETVFIISSDLSHFHSYAEAQNIDRDTMSRILSLTALESHQQACGATPINGAIRVAKTRGLKPQELGYMNSGDAPHGDKQRVVGYGAIAFIASNQVDRELLGQTLLQVARQAIDHHMQLKTVRFSPPEWLQHPGASFVTLTIQGQLRGCIGSLQAHRSLLDDVRHNAVAAASKDPRFKPLTAKEWAETRIEVSLLSAPQVLKWQNEVDALRQIKVGEHGVILSDGRRNSTFLPQVWKQLPDKADFWARLKQKAGWAADHWADDMQVSVYTVSEWIEAEATA